MTHVPISAAEWQQAGERVAQLALDANCQDEFGVAAALRALATTAFTFQDEMILASAKIDSIHSPDEIPY